MKNLNLRLINEWSEKRNRLDSHLLDWNHTNNNELEWFDQKATNFVFLDQFYEDLDDFLFVFTQNTNRARRQFEDLYHVKVEDWYSLKMKKR